MNKLGYDQPRAAFDKLSSLLHYVDGDYKDAVTFSAIRRELGSSVHPAHYLAIPPVLFGLVVERLGKASLANGARVIVEKVDRRIVPADGWNNPVVQRQAEVRAA